MKKKISKTFAFIIAILLSLNIIVAPVVQAVEELKTETITEAFVDDTLDDNLDASLVSADTDEVEFKVDRESELEQEATVAEVGEVIEEETDDSSIEAENDEITVVENDIITADTSSRGMSVEVHSKEEIKEKAKNLIDWLKHSTNYARNPVNTAPYDMGQVSDETLQTGIEILNLIRYIAGIPYNVQIKEEYQNKAQAAALVNAISGQLTHSPKQPENMDDVLYQLGAEGAASSNIARGYINLYSALVDGWMSDENASNIDKVGHRRWCLNPTMQYTGFGINKNMYTMYALDGNFKTTSYYGVAWPAQNMLLELFADNEPWSISMGKFVNSDSVKVTLRRIRDGKEWNFSKESADGDFYVNNEGYGLRGCIIFRPNDVGGYRENDCFQVEITGSGSSEDSDFSVTYNVEFFSTHEHVGGMATCQKRAKCDICGRQYGELVEHSYSQYTVDVSSTCTRNGIKRIHCDYWCGAVKEGSEQIIPARGHAWELYEVTKVPTCMKEGSIIEECGRWDCEETRTKVIEATKDITKCTATLSETSYMYDGKAKEPTVILRDEEVVVPEDAYEVTYSDNTEAGEATVIITGANGYTGKIETYFIIEEQTEPVNVYTITYDANGGKNAPASQTKEEDKTLTLSKTKPTRTGYTFLGWATSKTSTKATYTAGAAFKSNKDTTLYAVWKANTYKIAFKPNGGTGSMATISCTYGKSYTLKANTFKRTGYTFKGWNTKADGTGMYSYGNKATVKNVSSVAGKTMNFYAQWTPNKYTITYQLNGGTNNKENPTSYKITNSTITLKNPTRKGYTFAGWYTSSSYKTKVTKITKGSTGNKTLYAKWVVNKYTLRYNGNGATSGKMSDTKSCAYNKTYTLRKNTFVKKGYIFMGWAKSPKGALRYKDAEKVTNISSVNGKIVNLYAVWHKHQYTVKTTKKATCTAKGEEIYTCSCQESYVKTIPAKGHTASGYIVTKHSTKTTDGLKVKKCITCGTILEEKVILSGNKKAKEQEFVGRYAASKKTNQLIIVNYKGGSDATLSFHQKASDGLWSEVFSTYAYVGKNGIDKKKEGDGKTPTGTFDIKMAFGIKANPGTSLPYTKLTNTMYWCSDKAYYNKLVDTNKIKHKCKGEHLISYTGHYNYSMVIEYNSDCVYGKGSAIFLHCTKTSKQTAGCIAIPESKMVTLLKKAKPDIKIVIS